MSFQQGNHRKFPTPYPQCNLQKEIEGHQEPVYEVQQDRMICSPTNLPVFLHFPNKPTGIVGQVTFNTQRQKYKLDSSPYNTIDLSYVIYHENHN